MAAPPTDRSKIRRAWGADDLRAWMVQYGPALREGYLFRTAANVLVRRAQRQTWDWDRRSTLDEAPELSDELSPERVLMGKEAAFLFA